MGFLIYLVMLVPNTERPTIVLMKDFDSVAQCNKVLAQAPAEHRNKFACMQINLSPKDAKDEA